MQSTMTRRRMNELLTQEMINSITLEFKQREWQWLTSLTSDYVKYLSCNGQDTEEDEFDPSLFTHYGEFFLTLSGIKPCFLITSHGHPTFADDLYANVISPLLNRLIGYELFRVADLYNNSPSSSPTNFGTNKVVYIFTSRYHQKFPLIEELFLKPHNQPVPTELLCKALGYPAPNGRNTFCYVDVTTTKELGVNCMTVFEFTARDGFDYSIKMHFEKCAAEFRKIGKVLTILAQ